MNVATFQYISGQHDKPATEGTDLQRHFQRELLADTRTHRTDAQHAADIVKLLNQIIASPDLRHACYTLVGELARLLPFQRVAIGLRRGTSGSCRVVAISGISRFDSWSAATQAIEAALDESILRDDLTKWPATNDEQRHALLAHKHLCKLNSLRSAVSIPLRDGDGNAVGALVAVGDSESSHAKAEPFLRAAESSLANSLTVARRLEGGRLRKLANACRGIWYSHKGKAAVAAMALCVMAMFVPLPYQVHCNCHIEPVTQRFVAVPFEGTLKKSLVKAGDFVHKGDVVAHMDDREIRVNRSSTIAERKQAIKQRDVAQASHNYADQQIAQLQVERLDLELQLLDYRANNLEIKSPIDGIVASGDWQRAEGMPLTIGTTLFEIAPLAAMIVEVAIPDDHISHVAVGQTIDIRLDAYPRQTWQAVLTTIQPRSEIRDDDNVFIAESVLDNTDNRMRPGMKGRAQIATRKKALGWILFHRPYEHLSKMLSW